MKFKKELDKFLVNGIYLAGVVCVVVLAWHSVWHILKLLIHR